MFRRSKLIALIFLLITVNVFSQPYHRSSHVQINAQLGSRVDLSCSFAPHERGSISWRVDGELIALGTTKMVTNPRIHILGQGALTIQPVERQDIKTYVCSSSDGSREQKFMLREETTSITYTQKPSPPIRSGESSNRYANNDNCNAVERLERKIDVMSDRLVRASESLQSIQVKMDYFQTILVSENRPNPNPRPQPTAEPRTVAPHRPYPGSSDTPRAYDAVVNGKQVKEYVWAIDRFDDEFYGAQTDGKRMLRTYFLTGVPGYNMSVRLYPNREGQGYLSVYAEPFAGIYDDMMPWPFKMNYELAAVSHYHGVNDIVAGTIKPSEGKCPGDAFSRRHTQYDGVACGYSRFMHGSEYRDQRYAFLKNGQFYIRIRLSAF